MTRFFLVWLLASAASSAYCVLAARELGPTFDEPFYVAKGLEFWRTGSHRSLMRAGTMPLPVDAQTLPVFVWEHFHGEPFDPVSDLHTLLPVARAANLPFWWLLLLYGGLLGRLWGGAKAGLWVTLLLACEPNLLAHAGLATTDIALTAGVLAAVYHFAAGQGGRWWQRWLVPGAAAGLAVACKASAITFVPLAWGVVALFGLPRDGGERVTLLARLRLAANRVVASALVAAVTLFVACGTDWATEPSFIRWADTLPDDTTGNAVRFTAAHLHIFPNAGEGLVQQVKHNLRGHGSYALGEWHSRAVWYYFPVVLSAKLPEPLLVLLAGLLLFRPRRLLTPAGLIAGAYLLFSLTCRVQIGVRLVFPLVAMLNVAAVVAVCRRAPVAGVCDPGRIGVTDPGYRSAATLLLLVALTAAISLANWPHPLRHCNHFWGGTDSAAGTLADSNYDWGQGLPELKRWREGRRDLTPPSPLSMNGEGGVQGGEVLDRRHEFASAARDRRSQARGDDVGTRSGLDTPSPFMERGAGGEVFPNQPLRLWYYGTDPACLLPPFELVQVNQMPEPGVEAVRQRVAGGYFAVGESFFTACPDRRPGTLAVLAWLNSQTPVTVVGTFRVYRIP